MQNFIQTKRFKIETREPHERKDDFREIYALLSPAQATSQASRCIQCGDPFCHSKCPLHNFIPFWLHSTSKMDENLSFNLSNESNPFPEITGRICPQDRLCEGDCTLNDGHGAITIGAIETYISENGFKKGLKPYFPGITTDKKVAVVGSGPASISVATYLLRAGIKVDMFEKETQAGGLLTFGIPGFKLEKRVVKRRFNFLKEAGMKLYLESEIGEDMPFDSLLNSYDAVFLGLGAESSRVPNLPNDDACGVFLAIDYLKNIQKKIFKEDFDKSFDVEEKNVVVVGGGDTAMDCLRTALREKAKSVKCIYRRDAHNMPGSKKEYKNAIEEGVEFIYNASPKEIIINSKNEAIGLMVQKTVLGEKDKSGRQKVENVKGSEFKIEADIIIFALGFSPKNPNFLAENGIQTDESGRILVSEKFETTKMRVYAGGDCQRGSHLVVTAAADGKEAAKSIVKAIL